MHLWENFIYSYLYVYNKIQSCFSKGAGEKIQSVVIYDIRTIENHAN